MNNQSTQSPQSTQSRNMEPIAVVMPVKPAYIALLFVVGPLSGTASAQDDYLAMDLEQLMQVSITGSTLRNESLKTVPSAVTVFSHEQIAVMGVDYLHELLSLIICPCL